jgi:hypothetical protein
MLPGANPLAQIFTPVANPSQVLILQRRLEQTRRDARNDRN